MIIRAGPVAERTGSAARDPLRAEPTHILDGRVNPASPPRRGHLDAMVTVAYSAAMESEIPLSIRVNRAPVLTLWAAIVVERLSDPPDTALTLGRFVAGSSVRAKAWCVGIADEAQEAEERRMRASELKPQRQTIRLLGRDVPVLPAADGTLRAEDDGKPASPKSVQTYIARAFGARLPEVRAATGTVAVSLPPEERNRIGFRLYKRFRPNVPWRRTQALMIVSSDPSGNRLEILDLPRGWQSRQRRPHRQIPL
jgi:hypothetical protein